MRGANFSSMRSLPPLKVRTAGAFPPMRIRREQAPLSGSFNGARHGRGILANGSGIIRRSLAVFGFFMRALITCLASGRIGSHAQMPSRNLRCLLKRRGFNRCAASHTRAQMQLRLKNWGQRLCRALQRAKKARLNPHRSRRVMIQIDRKTAYPSG